MGVFLEMGHPLFWKNIRNLILNYHRQMTKEVSLKNWYYFLLA